MAEIRWTEEANLWLQDIFDCISQDNPLAAKRVVRGIYDKAQILESFPEIGYKYQAELEADIRVLLYGHYRIAYLIKEEVIEILGVFHGSLVSTLNFRVKLTFTKKPDRSSQSFRTIRETCQVCFPEI